MKDRTSPTSPELDLKVYFQQIKALQDIGALFYEKGWSLGTSSNYSTVVNHDPLRLLITASGKDKASLTGEDFLLVDQTGQSLSQGPNRPSAETMLHVVAAQQSGVGAVLHTHSVWATILSNHYHLSNGFAIEGYEMLKGLSGIDSHERSIWVEIFENTQDIEELSRHVSMRMADKSNPLLYGFLIRRHGLYTWGRDLSEARRHVEIFEFLFEVIGRSQGIAKV